jgi:hypothetical protein
MILIYCAYLKVLTNNRSSSREVHIFAALQVGGAGGGAAATETAAQPRTPDPAPRPGEHHHRPGCHTGGWHQARQYRSVLVSKCTVSKEKGGESHRYMPTYAIA